MKTKIKLSEQQIEQFDIFGFLIFPKLLQNCIDRITEEFEAVWSANGGGHNGVLHDGSSRSAIVPFADQSKYLSSLLDDNRIHDIASSLCGDDFNYIGGDGNLYTGDTQWHSDGYGTRPVLSIKIAFYLDPVEHHTGALRVIPGSHRIHDHFADCLDRHFQHGKTAFGLSQNQIPSVTLESTPGDVLVFNHNIKHSSFGGSQKRRMYTMNFSQSYPDDKLQDLRENLGKEARFWIDRIHGDLMINTAGPDRMVHLRQVRENDSHLRDLTQELKKTMEEPARG